MVCIHIGKRERESARVYLYIYITGVDMHIHIYVCVLLSKWHVSILTCIYIYLNIQRLICAKTSRNSTTPGHQLRHLAESAKIRIKSGKKETSKNRGLNSWLNRDIAYNSLFGCSNGHALEFFHGFSIVVRKSLPSYREQRLGETCRKQQTSNQTSRARARICDVGRKASLHTCGSSLSWPGQKWLHCNHVCWLSCVPALPGLLFLLQMVKKNVPCQKCVYLYIPFI